MNKFDEREKSFEKKFAKDQELQFKISARRNKYLGECSWKESKNKLFSDMKYEWVVAQKGGYPICIINHFKT